MLMNKNKYHVQCENSDEEILFEWDIDAESSNEAKKRAHMECVMLNENDANVTIDVRHKSVFILYDQI